MNGLTAEGTFEVIPILPSCICFLPSRLPEMPPPTWKTPCIREPLTSFPEEGRETTKQPYSFAQEELELTPVLISKSTFLLYLDDHTLNQSQGCLSKAQEIHQPGITDTRWTRQIYSFWLSNQDSAPTPRN